MDVEKAAKALEEILKRKSEGKGLFDLLPMRIKLPSLEVLEKMQSKYQWPKAPIPFPKVTLTRQEILGSFKVPKEVFHSSKGLSCPAQTFNVMDELAKHLTESEEENQSGSTRKDKSTGENNESRQDTKSKDHQSTDPDLLHKEAEKGD